VRVGEGCGIARFGKGTIKNLSLNEVKSNALMLQAIAGFAPSAYVI
jgi:hypothetical protein